MLRTLISWQWTFISSNFMNLPNQFHVSLVVVVGREGVITHDVTLGAYNTNKFLEFI